MFRKATCRLTLVALGLMAWGANVRAGNLGRSGVSNNPGAASNSVYQSTTAATAATAQISQAAVLAQRAQISLQRSVLSLQAIQAQANAQSAARNLAISSPGQNLGAPLPSVPDGLAVNGLVPGVAGTDPANPIPATIIPVSVGAGGTDSVTLAAHSAITLPPGAAGGAQISVSGTGTVGTITTGGTITPLTGGVTTTAAPGSTISLTGGGTITFAAGSEAIPTAFSTYTYSTPATATAAAGTSSVPSSWSGVGGLAQSTFGAGGTGPVTVTVTQTAQQALLTWQTFNIGKNTTLDFDQSQGGADVADWVAINKVAEGIAPSQILGSIQAPGQVYVINQNGILFGGSSQINVGALVASSLPINDNLVNRGLLNNPDLQFIFSQLDLSAGSQGPTAAFTPQGTSSSPGSAPAPGSYGTSGGVISQVDSSGNLSFISANGQDGDVVVQAGAQLSSPTTPEHVGGRIALVGPNVDNSGTISTPDGQTILAAGLQVGMTAHPSTDPTLRGLDVAVGAVSSSTYDGGASGVSGTVANNGTIDIPRADLTMVGATVDQNAVVESSTSVTLNGRVDLLADYDSVPLVNGENGFNGASNFYPTAGGIVSLGANSLTEILPELSSSETVVGTQLALSSLVNVQGGAIDMEPDSLLLAPSAAVPSDSSQPALGVDASVLAAGVSLSAGEWLPQGNGTYALTATEGQVYLGAGATIDVSGSENVSASVLENIISAQLLGTELADSPLQQNGALRGATISVDIRQTGNDDGTEWVGTPIGDISGYVNLIERTVGELTTAGGAVALNAGGSTVLQPGSAIDVSGGWINYQGATVQTTKVVSNGLVYDISQATPNLVYSGIYHGASTYSSKWNVGETYNASLQNSAQFEAGYLQGGNGGSLSISTPALALDGALEGSAVAGTYQRTPASQVASTFAGTTVAPTMLDIMGVPIFSTLSLTFQAQDPSTFALSTYSPTPPNVIFQTGSSLPPVAGFETALPAQRLAEVDLSPDLFSTGGFGTLNLVDSVGTITVPAHVALTTPADGAISLQAANIDIEGSVTAPSGTLSFTTDDFSPYIVPLSNPAPDPTLGIFTLGTAGSLSTAGLIVDDRPTAVGAGTIPLATGGGSITIDGYTVDLESSDQKRDAIDVSGGMAIGVSGKITYGNAGSLVIEAGQDPHRSSILGGQLDFDPALVGLTGYSGGVGGSFTIKAPLVQIGGSELLNGDTSGNTLWLDPTDTNGNLLQSEFFNQGGFTQFTVSGIGEVALDSGGNPTGEFLPAVLIAPNSQIDPEASSRLASLNGSQILLETQILPEGLRSPVSLTFTASGATDPFSNTVLARGDFIMDAGAMIETDPQTNSSRGVTINGNTAAVLGDIIAPGGTISIGGGKNAVFSSANILPTVDIGPDSVLSTAGTVNLVPNIDGYRIGSVLNGGTISISGNIVAEAGAILDVSGASGILDVSPAQSGAITPSSSIPVATLVDSNGGSIILAGGPELFADATLLGRAGGSKAQGGTLSISSGINLTSGFQTPLDATLVVKQSGPTIPVSSFYPAGETAIGNPVVDANGNVLVQRGYFAADSFNSGGFSSLILGGTVQFSGPVTLTAGKSLTIGQGGVIFADAPVDLIAPYVDLGMPFQSPVSSGQATNVFAAGGGNYYFSPTHGAGDLNVTSLLIDIGDLSLQDIGHLTLDAAGGDIRGDGTLDVAGTISMTAGQIYPTTDNSFTVAAYDYNGLSGNGSVTIVGEGSRQLPLSAGGELNIYASNIEQGGVLRAPLGTINLGSGVTGSAPVDLITGSGLAGVTATDTLPATQNLTVSSGSVTSVSAVDPLTGQTLTLPYGINSNGVTWLDPAGNDITVAGNGVNGIPVKSINLSAAHVIDQSGVVIDISGGGDFYSYSFVTGTGGTQDILASTTSFAVIPGYQAAYAPYYSSSDYINPQLAVGEQVYLNASNSLPAGVYTLLPARYALQPGAFLVTPQTGAPPLGSGAEPDGSSLVSGYEVNGFNSAQTGASLFTSFEVDPPAVVAARASYDVLTANSFLAQSAVGASLAVPRLPLDAGQLVLAATQTLSIAGSVDSQSQPGGLGGLVDITSTSPILISGPATDLADVSGSPLVLNSSALSAFGADSLLIGGYREATTGGDSVVVTTNSLTVDNAGASVLVDGETLDGLSASDLILVSNQTLTLAPDAEILQSAKQTNSAPSTLFLTGDGTLLRVNSSPIVQTIRTGVNTSDTVPSMVISDGVELGAADGGAAGSIVLDSTCATSLASGATLNATSVDLDSGQISLELTPLAAAPATSGLVLSGSALSTLQTTAQALALLSYSSIDIYGSGQIGGNAVMGHYPVAGLALHAAEIRGFSNDGGGGTVSINAQNVTLDNDVNGTVPGAVEASSGSLTVNAAEIDLGAHQLDIDQYSDVNLDASNAIVLSPESKTVQSDTSVVEGTGSVNVANNLTLNTPLITAGAFATTQAPGNETLSARGHLVLGSTGITAVPVTEGLGGKLTLTGDSVTVDNMIELPSGSLAVHATGGDVTVGGTLDAAGTAHILNDLIQYTSGGQIELISDAGSVDLTDGSVVEVAANAGGGNAGSLSVNVPAGTFDFSGSVMGAGGASGQAGTFSLDVAGLSGGNLQPVDTMLDAGGFTQSISIRDRNDAVVSIDGTVRSGIYDLSVDQGSIVVGGTVDASNVAAVDSLGNPILTGGTINLTASGGVTLEADSTLTVAAQNFDNAGKGGSVTLTAGAETNGNFANTTLNTSPASGPLVDIEAGSTIDLSVAVNTTGSAALGDLTGTLVLSAPQTAGNTDLQVAPINGTILNASSIVVEGNQVFNASSDGSIDHQEANVMSNGQTFAGNTSGVLSRLYQSNAQASSLQTVTSVEPGAEIINPSGDLTLAGNWDLSTYRFGPSVVSGVDGSGVPGILTLRAAGNIVFDFGASLSDGFDLAKATFSPMWTAPLLPAGSQSWSYQMTAGADFSSADWSAVQSPASLQAAGLGGSVLLGEGAPALPTTSLISSRETVLATLGYFQTIRTGTGNIAVNAGGDVLLVNNLATVYTAGTQASALTGFTNPTFSSTPQAPNYTPQYTLDGGNLAISAQGDIAHETAAGTPDSSLELPTSWLYRQGALGVNGEFVDTTGRQAKKESTSWWVDFSNFFEGVGTLGGGNVTLTSGGSIDNVDAVAATNARMPLTDSSGALLYPNAANLLELGGGNVTVTAGDDIDGGVYYVERGQGELTSGNQILTNSTRAAVTLGGDTTQSINWLPTTLFLGQGSFSVNAGGDLLLGPVANPFLLPSGVDNGVVNESYFSTYASADKVGVTSLGGTVTLKDNATDGSGSLANWYTDIYMTSNNGSYAYTYQPWLLTAQTSFSPFLTVAGLMPPTLDATAFSGDLDVVGNLTLSPSPTGNVNLLAAGSLNGFQINTTSFSSSGAAVNDWGSSVINLSDANPASIPNVASPLSPSANTGLTTINNLFAVSGATADLVLQTKQELHADIAGNVLHANDPNPVHLYAETGNISGFTLYSGKQTRVIAGQDITDIALYLQNDNLSDISLVAAGRDLIAYDPDSSLRLEVTGPENAFFGETEDALQGQGLGGPNAGDLQIAGPGTLEVLAGRNLNLGVGPNNGNGTGVGISSIGNTADASLATFSGADIIAGAGMGGSGGLSGDNTKTDFAAFESRFLAPGSSSSVLYLPQLGALMGLDPEVTGAQVWSTFNALPVPQQDTLALEIFYRVIRDSGRNHNNGTGEGYASGYQAIQALFPGSPWPYQGNISLTSREIKTTNGGNISLLAPGGGLTVGYDIAGNQPLDQGILTEDGGNISIFTAENVDVGTSRIFTLHGGNEIIWSTYGDIAAGNSSKTVQSAPPTQVLVDPQSGAVQTDLAGLATGGGIGVLETVVGAPPSDVDLVAPNGTVNAGDAGIRVSGNLSISALRVLNAGNIQVGGKSSGVPATSAPNVAGLSAASSAAGSATGAENAAAGAGRNQVAQQQPEIPSIITVQILGYGGTSDE